MNLEALKQAVMKLSSEDKLNLALEIGPALCENIMKQPGGMEQMMSRMMPMCSNMMAKRPDMMARMSEMMPSMMKK